MQTIYSYNPALVFDNNFTEYFAYEYMYHNPHWML